MSSYREKGRSARLAHGDVCLILNDPRIIRKELIGTECTFVNYTEPDPHGHNCIIVTCVGERLRASEAVLLKRQPPRRQRTVPWSTLIDIWQPKDLRERS